MPHYFLLASLLIHLLECKLHGYTGLCPHTYPWVLMHTHIVFSGPWPVSSLPIGYLLTLDVPERMEPSRHMTQQLRSVLRHAYNAPGSLLFLGPIRQAFPTLLC